MNNNRIAVSWLLTHGFCEYKFFLQFVVGIKIAPSVEMHIGSIVHESKEKEFLETAIPSDWKSFLASSDYTITKEILLNTKFETNVLIGKIDEIAVDKNGIYIIEGNFPPRFLPDDSSRLNGIPYYKNAIITLGTGEGIGAFEHELGHTWFPLEGGEFNTIFPGINLRHVMRGGSGVDATVFEAIAMKNARYLRNFTNMAYTQPLPSLGNSLTDYVVSTVASQRACR